MLAETVLAAFAVAAALFKAQQIYGVRYDQRTERLHERSKEFYAAANALLRNPDIDAQHLSKLKEMHEAMNAPAAGRIFARVARDMHIQVRAMKASGAWAKASETRLSQEVPTQLMLDFVDMADAAMLLVAERDALWGPLIIRRMRQLFRDDVQPHHRAEKVIEAMADNRMMHAA